MPAKNPRLNVVLDKRLYQIVTWLAQKENKSMSEIAKELMEDAIEKHEELLLSQEVMKRESLSKKTIPHDKVWK
ncbi:MAG: DUF6290 family protein [Bdellovibrionales bacterium]|nr:DUF6290 family protein [Bdellovibrionales bacterium]